MDDMNREEYGKMLREIYINVLIGIVVCVCIVTGIFQSSRLRYEKEVERQEIRAAQLAMQRNPTITAWAWVNKPEYYKGRFLSEYRELVKLEKGEEYIVGQLREYDRNKRSGFVQVMGYADDHSVYYNPALTFYYSSYLHIETSLDNSWLVVGPTEKGIKTGEYNYLPAETDDPAALEGWGVGMTSAYLPVNGRDNLTVMGNEYNYYTEERLGDVYEGVAGELADRTRRVWVYHVFVSAYNQDPKDKKSQNPEQAASLTLRVRYYDVWDITQEEFETISVSDYNFTPHTTVEIVE